MKTVAIAADTIFVIDQNNNSIRNSSPSSHLTLLITLTSGRNPSTTCMKNAPTMAAATATVMNNSYPNNKSSIGADDASDILVTSSYVDTVVTLRLRHVINNKLSAPEIVAAATTVERGTNNNANENIRTNHDSDNTIVDDNIPSTVECITSSWKKKKPSGQEKLSNNEENCSWSGNNNNNYDDDENDKTTNNNETLVVHSLWQAEIQDRVYDDDNN